jgi:hypothetical protein
LQQGVNFAAVNVSNPVEGCRFYPLSMAGR